MPCYCSRYLIAGTSAIANTKVYELISELTTADDEDNSLSEAADYCS